MTAAARSALDETPLAERLAARIATEGPLRVDQFMEACLTDPAAGLYGAGEPIGAQGHFITAPEISQIFGELIGLWAVSVWQAMGEPASVTIAEMGPGRGTLMDDAMRAWRSVPRFAAGASVVLIETSPVLAEVQKRRLGQAPLPVRWSTRIEALHGGPLILFANEVIDALPVRQLVRRAGSWRERRVAADGQGGFVFTEGVEMPRMQIAVADAAGTAGEGDIFETRPAAHELIGTLAQRAERWPLAALFIDYGHDETGFGDTLQAVRAHRYAPPLAAPGEADLSAQVDFAALKKDAETQGLEAYGPMPQGEFLLKLGLGSRRDRLLASAGSDQKEAIASGAARLVDPAQMGVLYKALVLASRGLPPPPPFS